MFLPTTTAAVQRLLLVEKKEKEKKKLPHQEEWISSHSNIWEQSKKFLTEHVIEILQLVEIFEVFTSLSECLMHGSNEGSKVLYTWP